MDYKTATNLAIFPKNTPSDVSLCASILDLSLGSQFAFVKNENSKKADSAKHPFPTPITVREALEYFVDLRGPIRKKLLKDLSEHAGDQEEKKMYEKLVIMV